MLPRHFTRILRTRPLNWTLPVLTAALMTGCGGSSEPSSPNPTVPIASVTLSQATASVQVGGTLQLTALARSADGTTLNGRSISWSSSAPAVATISASGLLNAVSAGTTTVTAASEGKSATATITVAQSGVIANVAVTGPAAIEIGVPGSATAEARTAGGAPVAATVAWTSSNTNVVTVSPTGALTGVSAGTATISAAASGVTGTLSVAVNPRNINSIVDSVRIARGLPALVGAIVTRSGGLVAIGVGGTRRATGGAAATTNDFWHIGSNLKAITGMLAAVAVKQGRISWTTTVASMFPELGAAIRPEYREVTLSDLLSMAGGIRNDPPVGTYAGTTAKAQRESAAAWGLAATPIGARGSYFYSNISYVIAGAMVERALTGTYEDLLRAQLGAPVGAVQIGFGPTAVAGSTAQPIGHSRVGGAWVACEACDNPPGLSAAGRSHMPIGDWARLIHELLKADNGTSTLIAQADARKTVTGVTPVTGGDPYAIGWGATTRPWGGRVVVHAGSNTTNHSVAWVGLDSGVAFLAATNAWDVNSGSALDGIVGRMLSLRQTGR